MRRDSITLQQLDDRGHDVRAWCFTCSRGSTIAIYYIQRFADLDLAAAATRFRCVACDSADAVALYPASRRYKMPATTAEPARDPDRIMSSTDLVAAIYFGARSAAKKAKRDAAADRSAAMLLRAADLRKPAPKRVPTKPPKLRLVGTPKQ